MFHNRAQIDGNLLRFVRARARVRALTTRKLCAVGVRNAILRNCTLKCFIFIIASYMYKNSKLCRQQVKLPIYSLLDSN